MASVKKIAIFGVGFMGGSLAIAVKKRFPEVSVWGYARSKESLDRLIKLRVVDKIETRLEKIVEDADMIVLALPVGVIIDYLKIIVPFLKKGAIVFDLGSSKKLIEEAALKYLPKNIGFVGCHPLCGSEHRGAEFSRGDLYQGAVCFVTSSPYKKSTKIVKFFWEELGSKVLFLSVDAHDKMLSSLSHLPHLISFSLTRFIPESYLEFCPASFKDLTRISSSPPRVWADILLSNKKNILKDLNEFIKVLKTFDVLLKEENKDKIIDLIKGINTKQKRIS